MTQKPNNMRKIPFRDFDRFEGNVCSQQMNNTFSNKSDVAVRIWVTRKRFDMAMTMACRESGAKWSCGFKAVWLERDPSTSSGKKVFALYTNSLLSTRDDR